MNEQHIAGCGNLRHQGFYHSFSDGGCWVFPTRAFFNGVAATMTHRLSVRVYLNGPQPYTIQAHRIYDAIP